jgi:folylpolyglutamate synthase/dihydropteroate synthase
MGRVSKEFKNLTKNVSQFLTEQETTQKNLKACRRVLESILKSRASEKKIVINSSLTTCSKIFVWV